ncbi:hypothetical protein BKA70DRAFT_1560197 [Coprinopsis sp. MPI-PUGE-AT-0042]|nr:hypothetical protein BKA70DRAFT_1560197 [Coprinopsis sp. MPI-PUGE-AT-0042]
MFIRPSLRSHPNPLPPSTVASTADIFILLFIRVHIHFFCTYPLILLLPQLLLPSQQPSSFNIISTQHYYAISDPFSNAPIQPLDAHSPKSHSSAHTPKPHTRRYDQAACSALALAGPAYGGGGMDEYQKAGTKWVAGVVECCMMGAALKLVKS